jgi:hypothetical protein
MNKKTTNLLIIAGIGVAALYFLSKPLTKGAEAAGTAEGAVSGGIEGLSNLFGGLGQNLGNAIPLLTSFNPVAFPAATAMGAATNAFNVVAKTISGSTGGNSQPQTTTYPSTNYYGATIYKQGVAYKPEPASAVQFTQKTLLGQVTPQQSVAYNLGLNPSQINPAVNKAVLNPVVVYGKVPTAVKGVYL